MASWTGDAIASPREAASLLALGFKPDEGGFIIRVGDRIPPDEMILYRFEDTNPDGLSVRDAIKTYRGHHISRPATNVIEALSEFWQHYHDTYQDIQLSKRVPWPAGFKGIRFRDEVAMLKTMDHAQSMHTPFAQDHDGKTRWLFKDTPQLREDIVNYRDPRFIHANPEVWLAYIGAAAITHSSLLDNIRKATPLNVYRAGESNIAVSATASPKLQDQFIALLEGEDISKL